MSHSTRTRLHRDPTPMSVLHGTDQTPSRRRASTPDAFSSASPSPSPAWPWSLATPAASSSSTPSPSPDTGTSSRYALDTLDTPMSTPSSAWSSPTLNRRLWQGQPSRLWDHITGGKGSPRATVDEEFLTVAEAHDPVSLQEPLSLPPCSLTTTFRCSDTQTDIPPAFYPGQAIPTILTFQLDRYSSLPHSLNPALTMSLVGTLHIPNTPSRTIICVSVSLAEGLQLWANDAQRTYAHRPPRDAVVDVANCLPGGTYSLPLTVQVPSTPRLPPSFAVASASFAVTYALTVTLTCDDPLREGARAVLCEAARPFEMMPETAPTRAPRYNPQSFWVRCEGQAAAGVVGTAKQLVRRPNSRWTVAPALPTTAFSPTSLIPLSLVLTPPPDQADAVFQILVRVALVRREHSSLSDNAVRDPSGQAGLVAEEEIISRWGWIQHTGQGSVRVDSVILPLMIDDTWTHGFSTLLNVGPPANAAPEVETISVSSTFHLSITIAFLNLIPNGTTLQKLIPAVLPPMGQFTDPVRASEGLPMSCLKRSFPGTVRTLPLPLVVGSVSEPRSAMHQVRWSDLHLDRSTGEEVPRMVNGEAFSCEDGWIMPPPAYGDALREVPYEYMPYVV